MILLRLKVSHQGQCTSEVGGIPLKNLMRWDVELFADEVRCDERVRHE
jgi:hypothetical protein